MRPRSFFQVPVPPAIASPILLSVNENYVGALFPSVANFTIDFQDEPLAYAIAFGNDAGYFSINTSTGVLYLLNTGPGLRGGLDFELQTDFVLMVSATEVSNSALSSTAEVDITGRRMSCCSPLSIICINFYHCVVIAFPLAQ